MADNFRVLVSARGDATFDAAFCLAFTSTQATAYRIADGGSRLVLYWHADKDTVPLPFPMDISAAKAFARNWLSQATYGPEPDIDGDCKKGFTISTGDGWGQVDGSFYSIMEIRTTWMMYGK